MNFKLVNLKLDKSRLSLLFERLSTTEINGAKLFYGKSSYLKPTNIINENNTTELIFDNIDTKITYRISIKQNKISDEVLYRHQKKVLYENGFLIIKNNTFNNNISFQINKIFDFKNKKLKIGAKIRVLYFLTKPFFLNKKIILFGERHNTRSDSSSYLFYNFYRKMFRNGYYLTDNKIYKNDIKINSIKHILYFLNSDVCVNSYDIERYMSFHGYGKAGLLQVFGDLLKYKKVFLQHGVFYNDISQYIDKNKIHFDRVVVSTEHEKSFLIDCGYKDEEIIETGLPRFMKLKDKSKESDAIDILIMPTWRNYIINHNTYMESDYRMQYKKLLNSLSAKLPDKKIVFFQHYELQNYNFDFESIENVEVITNNDEIPNLIMKSKLMITDYSSVLFDMSYMNKPVILFQFDYVNFFSIHTKMPLINLNNFDNINVCKNIPQVLNSIDYSKNKGEGIITFRPNNDNLQNLCREINDLSITRETP